MQKSKCKIFTVPYQKMRPRLVQRNESSNFRINRISQSFKKGKFASSFRSPTKRWKQEVMVMKKQTNKQKKGDDSVLASPLGNVNWEKEAFNNNGMYGVCIKGVLSSFRSRLWHESWNVGSWIQCLRIWCVIGLIKNIPISVLPWPIKRKEWNNRYSWNYYTCVTTEKSLILYPMFDGTIH